MRSKELWIDVITLYSPHPKQQICKIEISWYFKETEIIPKIQKYGVQSNGCKLEQWCLLFVNPWTLNTSPTPLLTLLNTPLPWPLRLYPAERRRPLPLVLLYDNPWTLNTPLPRPCSLPCRTSSSTSPHRRKVGLISDTRALLSSGRLRSSQVT